MKGFLKIKKVSCGPEMFVALEYESSIYVSWAKVRTIPNIQWQSAALAADEIAALLVNRGWHPTDVGDELDEARKFTRPEA